LESRFTSADGVREERVNPTDRDGRDGVDLRDKRQASARRHALGVVGIAED
jgi:hypothetical protein